MDWTSMGCTIVGEAASGEEGLSKISELNPDIVLVDIMMPGMDGIAMIRKAKEDGIGDFKSVILTSYAEFDYAKKAIDLDVSAYLMKPASEEEIQKSIKKIIEEIEKENVLKQYMEKKDLSDIGRIYIKSGKDNDYVQQVIDRTKERFAEKISIETLSDELGVSASYLSRKFKEATGHTYLDFLNEYRVREAVKLLETGKYKVYEVSDMTGFTDYKHFNAVFKRYTEMSPSDFLN